MKKKIIYLLSIASFNYITHPEFEYSKARTGLDRSQHQQQAKITKEYEERFGLHRQQVEQATQAEEEQSFQDWIQQSKEHVTTPSYSKGTTTPFQEAVNTDNLEMGQATIAAARMHEVSDNELLAPLKTQYDYWIQEDPQAAQSIITSINSMQDPALAQNFYTHSIQRRLVNTVRSIPKDDWNIDTMDNRWMKAISMQNLPLDQMREIITKAVSRGVPLEDLLEPFQSPTYTTKLERNDPRMMSRLQANHRAAVQRKVIEELYNEVQERFTKAQVKRDNQGKPILRRKNPST